MNYITTPTAVIFIICGFYVCPVTQLITDHNVATEHNALTTIVITECENPPCLFGNSLSEMTPEDTIEFLTRSNLADAKTIAQNSEFMIYWQWSDIVSESLGTDTFRGMEFNRVPYTFNTISFRNGLASEVTLTFTIGLEEIIDLLGNPDFALPYTYSRTGGMFFSMTFHDIPGYFIVSTRCDQPEFQPNTRIVGYVSDDAPNLPHSDLSRIRWEGYTTDLPSCTIFQP